MITVGGIVSALIDIDAVALVYWKSRNNGRLKSFRNPLLYKNYSVFLNTIAESGILKMGTKTHLITSALVILIFHTIPEYSIPVLIAAVTP